MITARYGNAAKTFIIVTFANGRTIDVPCDQNNALYSKIIDDKKIVIEPYGNGA